MAGEMMAPVSTAPADALETAIPDIKDIPADRLAELGGPALAAAVALYRERLADVTLSSFQARI